MSGPLPYCPLLPFLAAPVAAGLAAVFPGQVLPAGASPEHLQDAFRALAVVGPGPSPGLAGREQRGDAGPLPVSEHRLRG